MLTTLLNLFNYETLDRQSAHALLLQITAGEQPEVQVAGFLSALLMRKPTIEELKGFRDAMMDTCIRVDLSGFETVDIVGTGGDGKNTFNISTTAAFVVAGAGIKVAKHGNYAATSISGSSDVLSFLGYTFSAADAVLNRQLDQANICFLHAPLFHPAMKHVASVRKQLGMRTFFNLLGPIINPASPQVQTLGVSHLAYARMYHYLLQDSGQQYQVIHSLDGYDEVSLTAPFKIITPLYERTYTPGDIGFENIKAETITAGASVSEAAHILLSILQGKGSNEQNQVVIANSGIAIYGTRPQKSLEECMAMARESLESGKAFQAFKKLIN